MASNESGSGASTSGGIRVKHYYPVGPAVEVATTGWGLGSWGGVHKDSLHQHIIRNKCISYIINYG